MEYSKLGNSGLEVSQLALGCMSFGGSSSGTHNWTLDEKASRPILQKALDSGINFFDTANAYSGGQSEEILGKFLADFARRDEVAIATKCFGAWGDGPNTHGLSRKAIFTAVDDSLRRLGTDYIDLLQIHRFDPATPLDETMRALDDLVRTGKVRYLGASSMFAWQFQKAQYIADVHGWTKFVSMQCHYNLLYREEEREMIPLCLDQGVALIPWSPLARGRLARPPASTSARSESDAFGHALYDATEAADAVVVERVRLVAERRSIPMAQVALAWLMSRPGVIAPIVGVTRQSHLDEAIDALGVQLSGDEERELASGYVPHDVVGHL